MNKLNTKKVHKFYEDAGHGWLSVKKAELDLLGISHLISPYSYQKGDSVYLEEDSDLSTFCIAYKKATGCNPIITHGSRTFRGHSPIRSYHSYYHKDMEVLTSDEYYHRVRLFQTTNRGV